MQRALSGSLAPGTPESYEVMLCTSVRLQHPCSSALVACSWCASLHSAGAQWLELGDNGRG